MNDFTKEELKIIQRLMEHGMERYCLSSYDALQSLVNRVQSMIDNYCEHEYGKPKYHCIDCDVSEFRCNKCACVSYEGLE